MNDIIKYSIQNILHRKLRNWLTILSILIGIAAIFTLISFGIGVQNYMDNLFEQMGSNKLTIQAKGFAPPGTSSITFTEKDVNAISKVNGVKDVVPLFITSYPIKYDIDKKGKWVYVIGVPTERQKLKILEETWDLDFAEGHTLRSNDKYKTFLGYNYLLPNKIFDKPLSQKSKIYIKGIPFKVVGFYNEVGNPQDDSNVYIPIETAKEIFSQDSYQFIIVKIDNSFDKDVIISRIEKALRKSRNLKESQEDFVVQTFEDVLSVFTNIISVLNAVLILIALISVVVSAVNIANSMYTSVLERVNEIGILKSIGAKNNVILSIFLVESGILGLVGGILGISLGYIISKIGEHYASLAGYSMLKPAFPLWLIISSLLFSFIVGMLSGVFPSKQASKLKPVDALRYE